MILSFFSCACLSSIYLLWGNVFSTICLFCGRVVVFLLLSFKTPLRVLCLSYLLDKCKYFPLVHSLLLWKNHGPLFCRLTFSLDFSDDVMIKFRLCMWNKNVTEVSNPVLISMHCIRWYIMLIDLIIVVISCLKSAWLTRFWYQCIKIYHL